MSDEFKPIETQEELNSLIGKRLERERNSIRSEYKDFDSFKAKAGKYDTDMQSFQTRISELTAEIEKKDTAIKGFEISSLRSKAAAEFGIPASLASRITGETEDEIRADAQNLSGFFKSQNRGYPERGYGEPETDAKDAALQRIANNLSKN